MLINESNDPQIIGLFDAYKNAFKNNEIEKAAKLFNQPHIISYMGQVIILESYDEVLANVKSACYQQL